MSETLGPASELDAVNRMLAAISVAPVSGLTSLPPDAATALNTLRAVSRDLQEEGWSFNREEGLTLLPDSETGEIAVPADVLKIDGTSEDVVERERKLFNRAERSFTFTAGVEVELVRHLPWDALPSVARRYATALATEQFMTGRGEQLTGQQQRDLVRAQRAFHDSEDENADLNVLEQSLTVSSTLLRSP